MLKNLVSFLVFLTLGCSHPRNRVLIVFDRVDGLKVGSIVQHKGASIGKVKSLELYGKEVIVTAELDEKTLIPVDSKVFIAGSLFDQAKIYFIYSDSLKYLQSGDTIKGKYHQITFLDTIMANPLKKGELENFISSLKLKIDSLQLVIRKDSLINK